MRYTQLTQEERYQIYALLKAGHNQTEIALMLSRHKSTINREIQHNTGLRGYPPRQAQHVADARKAVKAHPRIGENVWANVIRLL